MSDRISMTTLSSDVPLILHGDSLDLLARLPDSCVHALVTDPPYGLRDISAAVYAETVSRWVTGDDSFTPSGTGFMGHSWDNFVPPPALWREALRVLKPGAHAIVFSGARTQDLMGMSMRLAGFDIRDCIAWINAQGFPKSHNIARSITSPLTGIPSAPGGPSTGCDWEGWGTALKPANEPIIVARKPLDGTIAGNTVVHGCGGLNIDATRTPGEPVPINRTAQWTGFGQERRPNYSQTINTAGRWPTNVVLSHTDGCTPDACIDGCAERSMGDDAKYFPAFRFNKKASKRERPTLPDGTTHSTVKPLALMEFLVKLVAPPGGVVLDPFAGSGTTLQAARECGMRSIGMEERADHIELIGVRLGNSSYDL